jgi:outer membrane receptor for ferrienterochelin and colicins
MHKFMKYFTAVIISLLFSGFSFTLSAQEEKQEIDDFYELSIEELMNIKVVAASGKSETKIDAPAGIIIITNDDIRNRGYTDLTEVLADLPGFDNILTNGTSYLTSYQRGYRTSFTQRTLLMVDGMVANHLWSHDANISRQYPMSAIEKIEIVYGPTSAVYGPNAFLGVINIITKKAGLEDRSETTVNMQYGSFNTKAIDINTIGKSGEVSYSFSQKLFRSDEPNLEGKWGFNTNDLYGDTSIWGPMLDQEHRDSKLGDYNDGADNYGFIGNVSVKDLKLGLMVWETKEGYGPYYAADRAQNNAFWNQTSLHIFLEHNKQIGEKLKLNTFLGYRESRTWGKWAEASPDWDDSIIPNDTNIVGNDTLINQNFQDYSWVSYTDWNSDNNSWLYKQNYDYQFKDNIHFSGGIKWERKQLTKAYDIPGYWNAFSSSVPSDDPGPHGYGAGIFHSSDLTMSVPQQPNRRMPSHNIALTEDLGGYFQSTIDLNKFRYSLGIRYDENSIYGSSINPRASIVYRLNQHKGAVKLVYGEAFQEPAPIQLFGGWNGRQDNPDLKPEKVRNIELITIYRLGPILFDASMFLAKYENVIKEGPENAGERTIYGGELKANYVFKNFIARAPKITGYLYYTHTKSMNSIFYDHEAGVWKDGERELGDIASHKVNIGVNMPFSDRINLNLRGNFVGKRVLYLRNPLRDTSPANSPDDLFLDTYPELSYEDNNGIVINPYFTLDGTLTFRINQFSLSGKVKNIIDASYFHPGVESASAGRDFTNRSTGFNNSILAQQGRSYMISSTITF